MQQVISVLGVASSAFKSCLFRMLTLYIDESEESLGVEKWVHRFVLSCLMCSNWTDMATDGIDYAFQVLQINSAQAAAIADEMMPGLDVPVWVALIGTAGYSTEAMESESGFGGLATLHRYYPAEPLASELWLKQSQQLDLPGVFSCLRPIMRYASDPEAAFVDLQGIFPSLGELSSLPGHWLSFLPKSLRETAREHASRAKPPSSAPLFEEKERPGVLVGYSIDWRSGFEVQDWGKLISADPYMALHVLAEPFHIQTRDNSFKNVYRPEDVEALIQSCISRPSLLVPYPELWGRLLEMSDTTAGNFRAALREAAKYPVSARGYSRNSWPFVLDLPTEAQLIPHILAHLLQRSSLIMPSFEELVPSGDRAPRKTIRTLVSQYVPDPRRLLQVTSDEQMDRSVRGTAAIMYMLHASGSQSEHKRCGNVVVECYEPGLFPWYLKGAGVAAREGVAELKLDEMIMIGQLLDAGRNDYEGRMEFDSELEAWRERSRAPVQTNPAMFV